MYPASQPSEKTGGKFWSIVVLWAHNRCLVFSLEKTIDNECGPRHPMTNVRHHHD